MKKFALITTMLLGTASIASAAPRFSFQARASVRVNARPVSSQVVVRSQGDLLPPRARTVIVRDHQLHRDYEVTPCMDTAYNVSGFYQGPAGDVQLTQRGNRIYGTFAQGGVMEGFIENGKITYSWTNMNGQYAGRGFWYIDGHGGLFGTWGTGNDDGATGSTGGNWNLRLASSHY